MKTNQQLEMEERLRSASAFLRGKVEEVYAEERAYRKQPTVYWDNNQFFESVLGMQLPLTSRVLFAKPNEEANSPSWLRYETPEPLTKLQAVFVATATAEVLQRGGFDDLWCAVVDQNFNGVMLQFRGRGGDGARRWHFGRCRPSESPQ